MVLIGLSALGFHIWNDGLLNIKKGSPDLLLHGVDYQGNICGISDIVKHNEFVWHPNILGVNPDSNGKLAPPFLSVCVISCPNFGEVITDIYGEYSSWKASYDTQPSNILYNCKSTTVSMSSTDTVDSSILIFGDFVNSASIIGVAGFVLSMIVSFLYLLIIRMPCVLRITVWLCIYIALALFAAGGYSFLSRSKSLSKSCDSKDNECGVEVVLLKAAGVVLSCSAVLWLSLVCMMRRRIALAINLIRECATALTGMVLLLFLPLLQSALFAGFTAVWTYFCVYLVSSGSVDTHVDAVTGMSFKTISYDSQAKNAIYFLVFVWFWSIGFIEAMGQIVSAHSVLSWYFAPRRSQIGSDSVLRAVCVAVRYHMGTAAMGSLAIALLRTLRMGLEYLQRKLAVQCGGCVGGQRLLRYCCCCVACLLLCFERCIKFMNKHAYIQCALTGSPFCLSAKRAFVIIARNLGRLAAVTVVGDFVVLVGKLSITLTCGGAAYLYLTSGNVANNGVALPVCFVCFVAFFTATMFLGVLSATADALLQACIVDEELQQLLANSGERELQGEGRDKDLRHLLVEQAEQWAAGEAVQAYDSLTEDDCSLQFLLCHDEQYMAADSASSSLDSASDSKELEAGGRDVTAVSPFSVEFSPTTATNGNQQPCHIPADRTGRYSTMPRPAQPTAAKKGTHFQW